MNLSLSRLELGARLAILALIIGGGVFVYLWSFRPSPESFDPDQPRPEVVAEGITTLPTYLFLGAVTVAIAWVAVAWRWRASH
jgi:hypothetical protein